jgi:aerobic carbon-monoxide dehydrogenase small subunit
LRSDITLKINGIRYTFSVRDDETLLELLRDRLRLTGVKKACDGIGECGSCTVLANGRAIYSCLSPALRADGLEIVTIEGLAIGNNLHPLQESFLKSGAIQCGFCTPGMILTAKALLDENPDASVQDIHDALSGNLCRCTGYEKIIGAVLMAKQTYNVRVSRR